MIVDSPHRARAVPCVRLRPPPRRSDTHTAFASRHTRAACGSAFPAERLSVPPSVLAAQQSRNRYTPLRTTIDSIEETEHVHLALALPFTFNTSTLNTSTSRFLRGASKMHTG